MIQVAQLLFPEYYRIYGQIRRTLSEARSGKVNELIPKEQLVKVNIPEAENEIFFLYRTMPIPMQMGSISMISAVYSTYFLFNWDNTKYVPMSKLQWTTEIC